MAAQDLAEPTFRAQLGASLSCLHLQSDKKKSLGMMQVRRGEPAQDGHPMEVRLKSDENPMEKHVRGRARRGAGSG